MSQITWKNVNSKSNNDAAYLMRGAQTAITGGLDRIAGVAQGIEQGRQDDYDQITKNNNNDFKDMLSSYRTTTEFNAARDSGVFEDAASSYGSQFDRELGRSGVADRGDALRDRFTADQGFKVAQQDYGDSQGERGLRGVLDQLAIHRQGTTDADNLAYNELYKENEAEINKLGLGADLDKQWNQSLVTEQDLRIANRKKEDDRRALESNDFMERTQRAIVDETGVDEDGRPDWNQARGRITQFLSDPNLPYMSQQDRQQLRINVDTQLAQNYGITADQLKQAETVRTNQNITSKNEIQEAQYTYDKVVEKNPVDKEFSFSESTNMGDVQALATKQGWDATTFLDWGTDLRSELTTIRKTFKEGVGKEVNDQVIDNIFLMALETSSVAPVPEGSSKFSASDLPIEDVTTEMERLLKSYESNEKNRVLQLAAKTALETQTEELSQKPGIKYQDKLGEFRTENQEIEKIQNARSPLIVQPRQ